MKPILFTQKGFTLIELMVVVVIVAIFAAIAIPSYQAYVRRANAAQAQQEVQRIATELNRWKSRNFNYLGYNLPSKVVQGYSFDVKDGDDPSKDLTESGVVGKSWIIRATSNASDTPNYSFLMTSTGMHCKNKTKANITATTCGTGSEEW